jgi:hypothetical protein
MNIAVNLLNAYKLGLSDIETKYLKALNAPDYSSRKDQVDNHTPGTFQWFLRDELVRTWLSEDKSSFLWVRGAPGQGKTVLSKFLLDHLASRRPDSQHHAGVIYYFFYDQDERFQTVESLLRSLIKQLLTTIDLCGHIAKLSAVDPSIEFEDRLWEVLEELVRASVLSTIFCVLDALDECKDEGSRKRLIWRITRLLQTSQMGRSIPVGKLLVTSRPIVDIVRELYRIPCIDLKANPNDLKMFIKSKVEALSHLSTDLKKSAAELLLGRAERTFLWVSIVLKKLKKITLPSLAKLRGIIEESPTDLDELYLTIINRIMEGTQEEQKLLAWVVYGRRPLTLKELEAALATQLDSKSKASTDEYRIDLTAEAVTSAAGVILEITDDDRVHLIHQSAKDFLLKNQQLSVAEFCNGLNPNIYLAKVCMVYLCFEEFETGPCGNRETLTARRRQYPLFDYAARNWHAHIQSKDDIGGISNIVFRLTKPGSQILLSWAEAAGIQDLGEAADAWEVAIKANIPWLAEFQSSDTIIGEEEVKEAVKNGIRGYNIIERLIKRSNIQFTEAAVCTIAANFNEGIMKLLLEMNDSIKVTHGLIKAAAANRKSGTYVMRLLLKSLDDLVLTPDLVEAAAENKDSCKEIIELLLRKENIQIADGAVAAIIKHFDAEVIKILPDEGDIKITEETVKAVAGDSRSKNEVMALLLGHQGADVHITERMVRVIAKSFNQDVVALLLDRRGADIQITEEVVKAVAANSRSHNEVMTMLLDRRGADAHITEGMVQVIAKSFNQDVMTLLLDCRGADIQITEEVVKAAAENY